MASGATPVTTPMSLRVPGWPARWPNKAARSRWCPPAILGVFAMATAVLEEAKQWPGVHVRVIPAMTAAQAVASRVGAPLGHDYAVISLSDRLKPWEVIEQRLAAAAQADLVLAIYNPASKSRTWQVGAMRDLLLAHRDPGTPVVIGRDVSGPREEVKVVRLADLDPADVDMRCLLIIGSSQTQWYSEDARTGSSHHAGIRVDPPRLLTDRVSPRNRDLSAGSRQRIPTRVTSLTVFVTAH